ncbi:GNAT family N-acetyltransferase [Marinicella sp. S1101]|uniref:GNAT family N-acetyltransferase n=1 Tax=Marinicella marina TaxID=2996016 RepID=UPI002260A478|nr:GNAT family N-acetyltransferase [Marinicella marina]MCX7553248.1 GNAT family N-acetyltransferase [Marinicella marina]MDJ1138980.1 GNAT family N-acetyltransferase [Marinicella marina]
MTDLEHYSLVGFSALSNIELYQILRLRSAVFVLEQNCAYQDMDDLDQGALHLFKNSDSDQIIAYARILKPEQCGNNHVSIGRVVVDQAHRAQHLGKELMQQATVQTKKLYADQPIIISAQTYLSRFYQDLGYVNTGEFYLEDDIPHQKMIYQA